MSEEFPLTPRLGRARDQGGAGGRRARAKILRAAARLRKGPAKPQFTGARIGRGRAVKFSSPTMPAFRMRRVVVKVHIARARGRSGAGAFRAHLNYLQRDGVERDGSGGDLYTREGEVVDRYKFQERGKSDRHQFRIIVSPEDGHAFKDLKSNTRALMAEMERDLGQRLDWAAVDHHNTGHPHTHIIIRGKDGRGRDLVIARDYLTRGLRQRATELATRTLGPRRDLEIMTADRSEVVQDRLTRLDKSLADLERSGGIEIASRADTQSRFQRSLKIARLKHLEKLHLAKPLGAGRWDMKPGWRDTLKAMGRRGDVIRSLSAEHSVQLDREGLKFWSDHTGDPPHVLGEVIGTGPDDELRDRRFVIVRDFDGAHWHVPDGEGLCIPDGAIVDVKPRAAEPYAADRVIDKIAERAGGFYSTDLHASQDPSSTAAFREAHKRRLEALRRAGLVERMPDGQWDIPDDFLKRAGQFERARGGPRVRVKSWLSLSDQITAIGSTWLDEQSLGGARFAPDAVEKRRAVLRDRGSPSAALMRRQELEAAVKQYADATGKTFRSLPQGDKFSGKFQKTIDLGQGRMALLTDGKQFVLVPWRRDMALLRGRDLAIERTRTGVSFSIGRARSRGISR